MNKSAIGMQIGVKPILEPICKITNNTSPDQNKQHCVLPIFKCENQFISHLSTETIQEKQT